MLAFDEEAQKGKSRGVALALAANQIKSSINSLNSSPNRVYNLLFLCLLALVSLIYISSTIHWSADSTNATQQHTSALMAAIKAGNLVAVKSEISGLENFRLPDGRTPLHLAVEAGRLPLVEFLVDVLDPTAADDLGRTAAMAAAGLGESEILKFLISRFPALRSIRDKTGHALEEYAATEEVRKVLGMKRVDIEDLERSEDVIQELRKEIELWRGRAVEISKERNRLRVEIEKCKSLNALKEMESPEKFNEFSDLPQ